MKRFTIFTLWSALLGLMLFNASCKKESDPIQPDSATNNGGFVASFVGVRWQMAGFELDTPQDLNGDGKLESDLMQFLPACALDNTVVFERSGKITGDNGKVACADDTDPAMGKPSTWTYDNSTKILRIVDGDNGSVSEWTVLEGTAKYLKVRTTIAEDGQKLGAVVTWKAA